MLDKNRRNFRNSYNYVSFICFLHVTFVHGTRYEYETFYLSNISMLLLPRARKKLHIFLYTGCYRLLVSTCVWLHKYNDKATFE